MTSQSDLTIMYRKWDSLISQNIAMQILPSSKPQGDNQTKSDLFQFQVGFTNPTTDDNVTRVYPDNGDDIAICDNQTRDSIMGNICAGKILKTEITGNGWSGNFIDGTLRPSLNYKLTVRQHEFSKRVFRLDYDVTTELNIILDSIILPNTIEMLGGVFLEENGTITVIDKYINFAENVDINQYHFKHGVPGHLSELLKIPAYDWGLKFYSRNDSLNGIKLIAQVQIWQD